MLRSIGNLKRGIRGASPDEVKGIGCGGKDLQKMKVLSLEKKSSLRLVHGTRTELHGGFQNSSVNGSVGLLSVS